MDAHDAAACWHPGVEHLLHHRAVIGSLGQSHAIALIIAARPAGSCGTAVPELLRAGYKLIYAQAENTWPPGTVPRSFVNSMNGDWIFNALLEGALDDWEEWF